MIDDWILKLNAVGHWNGRRDKHTSRVGAPTVRYVVTVAETLLSTIAIISS